MQNLDDSLSMYYALRQQKAAEISTRIGQIQQQLAAELLSLQELEQQLLSAQENVLEQIRPVLTTDARSFLSMPQFQEFVRDLLKEVNSDLAPFSGRVAKRDNIWKKGRRQKIRRRSWKPFFNTPKG
jgi:hypothetical protein